MNRLLVCGIVGVVAGRLVAAQPALTALMTVDSETAVGPIKPMNSVNGGPKVAPVRGDQPCGNFDEFRAARIPMARTHDCINCVSGGPHTCDISALFPNFEW